MTAAPGVQLPPETTASALFHRLLRQACEHFADLREAGVPGDPKLFKRTFGSVLPKFEAARLASKDRSAIARRMTLEAAGALVYRTPEGRELPLAEYLGGERVSPLPLRTLRGESTSSPEIEIPLDGEVFRGDALRTLVDRLAAEHAMTGPAADALRWVFENRREGLDLRGFKFALLGAGAELAPTRLLLAAGAEVLWIDVADPGQAGLRPADFSGALHFVDGGADLLTQPREVLATIEAFGGDDPVWVGMFAYAAGQGREWRLEAAMNAITRALPRERVAGLGLYISPTSAARVQRADAVESGRRRATAPGWQKLLGRSGQLGPALAEQGKVAVSRAIVPIQGASYQATQYIAKSLVAEAFATSRRFGVVSANVAGITNTGSMSLSVFQAGFVGAKLFGVRIFEPATTRWLSGLLMIHDFVVGTDYADAPARIFERQIHGGVYAMAWALDDAIRYAALYGFARRPSLLGGMIRGR